MTSRIAYFVNAYPAVSHSFIRREIHGLEKQGFAVERIALRGWKGELVDKIDYQERSATHYIMQLSVLQILRHVFAAITTFGVGDPQALAEGISEALVTTAAGLSVGIPSLMFHRYFRGKVNELTVDMEQQALKFMKILQKVQ